MFDYKCDALNSLSKKGAFLTAGEKPNPMTVSWGFIGQMWGKPVVIVPVRNTRYTKGLIDQSGEFTLSIPTEGSFAKELAYCGSHSGRDTDKIADLKLAMSKASQVNTYYVDGCPTVYQCKVLTKIDVDDKYLDENLMSFYAKRDFHVFYIGEIL